MGRLFDAYRAIHEQGFVPIFVLDAFDTQVLMEGCLAAGVRAIEYTLRRPDAKKMIPWIRKRYPDMYLLAGSTLDSDRIVTRMRSKHPQLMTLRELKDAGVDGFVSMLGWRLDSIREYAPTHVVIPSAHTATEAFQQVDAGAHLVKMSGNQLDLVRTCRMPPTFDYCPIFVTGGMTVERIPEAVRAGAIAVASGFDVILKGRSEKISVQEVADAISVFVRTTQQVRNEVWPKLAKSIGADKQTWLDALPHYHPF